MATHGTTTAIKTGVEQARKTRASVQPARGPGAALVAVLSLWRREMVRFYRQRSRVVGVIASPVLFWLVIGSGFGTSFRMQVAGGEQHYLEYFFPGAVIMIVLFTSIFAMMSLIEDRREGFLLSVLVAPVHRSVIVLGKVLGGTTLAALQGMVFLAAAPLVGATLSPAAAGLAILVLLLVSFSLTALGFVVAWRLDSAQGFHAVINLFLIPLWLLSGALFPVSGASGWIRVVMQANPLTYGVEALRMLLFPAVPPQVGLSVAACLAVVAAFGALMFVLAFLTASRRSTRAAG